MESLKERSAWSCFSSVDEVSAVTPYTDVLGVKYAYDSTVANHKNINVGDLLLLRDEILIYGHGLVRDVRAEAGVKAMQLCPACRNSGPEVRRHKLPKYRCSNCKHEFNEQDLLIEERPIQRFEAWYDATWTELPEPLPRASPQRHLCWSGSAECRSTTRVLECSRASERSYHVGWFRRPPRDPPDQDNGNQPCGWTCGCRGEAASRAATVQVEARGALRSRLRRDWTPASGGPRCCPPVPLRRQSRASR